MFEYQKIIIYFAFLLHNAEIISSKNVTCDKYFAKHVSPDEHTECTSTDVYLCQAILEGGVYLECLPCSKNETTSWTLPDRKVPTNTTSNNTLYIPVGTIKSGCYYCQCENTSHTMHINVTVEPEKTLVWQYNDTNGHMILKPDDGVLRITDTGHVSLTCTASGYPDPLYDWTYINEGQGDDRTRSYTEDPCLNTSSNGRSLIITPCQLNTGIENYKYYQCNAYNGLSQTGITFRKVSVDRRK
jgi:hypothetical protein